MSSLQILRDVSTIPGAEEAYERICSALHARGTSWDKLSLYDQYVLRCTFDGTHPNKKRKVAKGRFKIKSMRKSIQLKRRPKAKSLPTMHTCCTAVEQLRCETMARAQSLPAPERESCAACAKDALRVYGTLLEIVSE